MTWKKLGFFGIATLVVALCLNVVFNGAAGETRTLGKVARRHGRNLSS